MNLGLRPCNFEFINQAPNLLKRDLLYFDQIHLCSVGEKAVLPVLKRIMPEEYKEIAKQMDFLRTHGLLCDFSLGGMLSFVDSSFQKETANEQDWTDLKLLSAAFESASKHFNRSKPGDDLHGKSAAGVQENLFRDIDRLENEATRISSAFLNRFAAKDESTAILYDNTPVDLPNFQTATVLQVVLEKLPVPSPDVEWSQIVEYRADPDSSAKFLALRVWMQDIARATYSKTEIEERIDYLINEYENHLAYHKLKFERATRHVLLNAPLEIIENLFKMNWSVAGKKRFTLEEKQFDLMQAHLTAPGRELAYISKANTNF